MFLIIIIIAFRSLPLQPTSFSPHIDPIPLIKVFFGPFSFCITIPIVVHAKTLHFHLLSKLHPLYPSIVIQHFNTPTQFLSLLYWNTVFAHSPPNTVPLMVSHSHFFFPHHPPFTIHTYLAFVPLCFCFAVDYDFRSWARIFSLIFTHFHSTFFSSSFSRMILMHI